MTSRDDMVITPRLRSRVEKGPRQRAREERSTERQSRRRRGRLAKLRRAMITRRAIARGRRLRRPAAAGGFRVGNAVRLAGRVLGVAAIFGELIIAAGQTVRRTEHGASGRLIDAQDANTIYGEMDEHFTAVHNVRGFFEGNSQILRAIANKGHMDANLQKAATHMFITEFRQATGEDMVHRDPGLDAPESLVDIGIAAANKAGLQDTVREVMEFMRKYMWFKGWFK